MYFVTIALTKCVSPISHWGSQQRRAGVWHRAAELREGSPTWLPVCVAPEQPGELVWGPGHGQEPGGSPAGGQCLLSPLQVVELVFFFNGSRISNAGSLIKFYDVRNRNVSSQKWFEVIVIRKSPLNKCGLKFIVKADQKLPIRSQVSTAAARWTGITLWKLRVSYLGYSSLLIRIWWTSLLHSCSHWSKKCSTGSV